jgi:DNA repair exonuclease SbcCD ATPase subunit
MTRFLNEQHRIEQMEKDFNNLIKTSQSVKEKLEQVSSSDDILSAVQVQIRKLEDSIKETNEKYQRIEKKNEVLEQTNEGIDRNFKDLQKTETAIKNADKIITSLSKQFESLRTSIELLASQNEKASNAVDKIASLDESLAQIEKRINDLNVAREWLARTETELIALDKDAKSLLKITKGAIDKEKGKTPQKSEGSVTPQEREDILRLKGQGWTTEEIAQAVHRSRSEIELLLELASRGV